MTKFESNTVDSLVDENYWPVKVIAGVYTVELEGGWRYVISPSKSDPISMPFNLPITAVVEKGRTGLTVIVDQKKLQYDFSSKLLLELSFCQGLFNEIEVYGKSQNGAFNIIRKQQVNTNTSVYKSTLIPFEISNGTTEVKVEIFKSKDAKPEASVVRFKLTYINNNSMVHLISMF